MNEHFGGRECKRGANTTQPASQRAVRRYGASKSIKKKPPVVSRNREKEAWDGTSTPALII